MAKLREYIEKVVRIQQLRNELVISTISEVLTKTKPESCKVHEIHYQGIVEELRGQTPENALKVLQRMVKKGYTYEPWATTKREDTFLPLPEEILAQLRTLIGVEE